MDAASTAFGSSWEATSEDISVLRDCALALDREVERESYGGKGSSSAPKGVSRRKRTRIPTAKEVKARQKREKEAKKEAALNG